MITKCPDCKASYDDARLSTICPHEAFLTVQQAEQKDLALKLAGKRVRFAHQSETEVHTIMAIGWDGMVQLRDLPGEFAPHLFRVVD